MTRFARFTAVLSLTMLTAAVAWSMGRPLSAFAMNSLRFWASGGLVLVLAGVTGLAAIAGWFDKKPVVMACVAFPSGIALGVAVTGPLIFKSTRWEIWFAALLCSFMWLLPSLRQLIKSRGALFGAVSGVFMGSLLVYAEIPARPHTFPRGAENPFKRVMEMVFPTPPRDQPAHLHGDDRPITDPLVVRRCGAATLELMPTLAFDSTSQDGFWPGVSTPDELQGEPPLSGDDQRAVIVDEGDWVTAKTAVPSLVRSHLNRFTNIRLINFEQPRIQFEATGTTHDFQPFDYPKGRAVQFAWVDGDELVVSRAHDAEKGPFTELARHHVSVLAFTLFDGETPQCTLRFHDFVSQADVTSISPTAGEGVRPNVIQFGIPSWGSSNATPVIHLSLAETGIGSGLETVMHAPGIYGNRIEILQSTR